MVIATRFQHQDAPQPIQVHPSNESQTPEFVRLFKLKAQLSLNFRNPDYLHELPNIAEKIEDSRLVAALYEEITNAFNNKGNEAQDTKSLIAVFISLGILSDHVGNRAEASRHNLKAVWHMEKLGMFKEAAELAERGIRRHQLVNSLYKKEVNKILKEAECMIRDGVHPFIKLEEATGLMDIIKDWRILMDERAKVARLTEEASGIPMTGRDRAHKQNSEIMKQSARPVFRH